MTHLRPSDDRDIRGSVADIERRLQKALNALANSTVSLDNGDPEGAHFELDEADSLIEAASKEVQATSRTLEAARERSTSNA